jgi:hypothetical protein
MDRTTTSEIEIFRAGSHVAVNGTPVTVSHADLAAIAEAYDPALGEAPLVVGHPKLNAPAYGWVRGLRAEGGVLFAAPDQVDEQFAGLVKAGRFKKRSASFFLPGSPGNPTPGQMYLRHVGFLGAAAPAVPGLRDASFAADDAALVVEFAEPDRWYAFRAIADLMRRFREFVVARDGVEQADQVMPSWQIDSIADAGRVPSDVAPSFAAPAALPTDPDPETDMSEQQTADFAARDSALSAREREIAERETKLRAQEEVTRRAAVVEFAAGLVTAGRLLPRQQAPVVELLARLEAEPQTLSFAAADGATVEQPGAEVLRELLSALPVQVAFGELGGGGDPVADVAFAAPNGVQVDRDRLELLGRAQAYQRTHPNTPFADAVRAVGG